MGFVMTGVNVLAYSSDPNLHARTEAVVGGRDTSVSLSVWQCGQTTSLKGGLQHHSCWNNSISNLQYQT